MSVMFALMLNIDVKFCNNLVDFPPMFVYFLSWWWGDENAKKRAWFFSLVQVMLVLERAGADDDDVNDGDGHDSWL